MTTTINSKLVLFGLIISSLVIYMFATGTAVRPGSISKPMARTEYVKFIYRGIPFGHKQYQDALSGIANPIGGHTNPMLHRDGDNNSAFTSWTTDFMVAYEYATNGLYGPCKGIILMKKVDLSASRFVDVNTLHGADIFNEKEIFVKGMINGCIPVLVKPTMERNEILNALKYQL
jgi:hypothetical protein